MRSLFQRDARQTKRARRILRSVRPLLEALEERLTPTTDIVNNLSGDPTVVGSLPYEVAHAQAGDDVYVPANLPGNGTITATGSGGVFLDINKNLHIVGQGANATKIDGAGKTEVFRIESGVAATITGLTIQNGWFNGANGEREGGGGIDNDGNLILNEVEVTSNQVILNGDAAGGGIFNAGNLILNSCTVNSNTVIPLAPNADVRGGGIDNIAQLTMTNDTVADNTVEGQVGGNSTGAGGGIYNGPTADLSMHYITVAYNVIDNCATSYGGGIFNANMVNNSPGGLTQSDSIVYNPGGAAANQDLLGKLNNDDGYNLFGTDVSSQIVDLFSGGDQYNVNPLLGPLQNNGGTTRTMALLPGSPAIGAGYNFAGSDPSDQRGILRPASDPDIGAYQHQVALPLSSPPPLPPQPPPSPPAPGGALSPFAYGIGPGSQPALFEVDQAGQVFAVPLFGLFSGHASPIFLSTRLVMGVIVPSNNSVMGTLLSSGGQGYLVQFFNLANPAVVTGAQNAVSNEIGSLGRGVWPPPTPSQSVPGLSGGLTDPLSIDVHVSDADYDTVTLSGSSTVKVIGDGNAKDGVNISAQLWLNQDYPLQPQDSLYSIDFSGIYTLTGHEDYQGNGYYGGEPLYLSSAKGLTLELVPGWTLYVNQSASPPYFTFTADLQQYIVSFQQSFGITAGGSFYAAPGG